MNTFGSDMILSILYALIALAGCFFGYRLMKFWIGLVGFVLGAVIAYSCADLYMDKGWLLWLITIGVGIVFALIAYKLYMAGIFLLCGGLAFMLSRGLIQPDIWWKTVICVVIGIVVGSVAMMFVKPMIILSTGIHGGISAAGTLLAAFNVTSQMIILVVGIVVSVIGIVFQFSSTKNLSEADKE